MKLVARGLGFDHGARTALAGLDLELASGARLAVLGPSGAGKTTLLRLLAGLEVPARGELELDGAPASAPGRLLLPPEARGVGFVFQDLALWPHLSVLETLTYVARGTKGERHERSEQAALRVGLGERLAAYPDQLSGGEQQRLALARALVPEPRLLLLDEPFAHLDPYLRRDLSELVLELCAERAELSVVTVTHLAEEALALGEALLVLEAGATVEHGPAAELVRTPRHPRTVELLGLGALLPWSEGQTPLGPTELRAGSPKDTTRVLARRARLPEDPAEGVEAEVLAARLLPDGGYRIRLQAGYVTCELELETEKRPEGTIRITLDGPCWGLV